MLHVRIQAQDSYRWVIVAAGGVLGCVAIGAMFSLPVFLLPISRDTGWSVTGVSSAMTVGFVALALASMAWGTLSDRWGPQVRSRNCPGFSGIAVRDLAKKVSENYRNTQIHDTGVILPSSKAKTKRLLIFDLEQRANKGSVT